MLAAPAENGPSRLSITLAMRVWQGSLPPRPAAFSAGATAVIGAAWSPVDQSQANHDLHEFRLSSERVAAFDWAQLDDDGVVAEAGRQLAGLWGPPELRQQAWQHARLLLIAVGELGPACLQPLPSSRQPGPVRSLLLHQDRLGQLAATGKIGSLIGDADDIDVARQRLEQSAEGRRFWSAFLAFLRQTGHHTEATLDVDAPPLAQQALPVLRSLMELPPAAKMIPAEVPSPRGWHRAVAGRLEARARWADPWLGGYADAVQQRFGGVRHALLELAQRRGVSFSSLQQQPVSVVLPADDVTVAINEALPSSWSTALHDHRGAVPASPRWRYRAGEHRYCPAGQVAVASTVGVFSAWWLRAAEGVVVTHPVPVLMRWWLSALAAPSAWEPTAPNEPTV
jgi:hypothetical protein